MPTLYSKLDMNQREILNARFHYLAEAPLDPVPGQYYWNTTKNRLEVYTGSGWLGGTVGKFSNDFQLQGGVEQEIEHGLDTEDVIVSFRIAKSQPHPQQGQAIQLDWKVVDENKIAVFMGGVSSENTTVQITVVG